MADVLTTGNQEVDWLIARLARSFPDDYKELNQARVDEWAADIESGARSIEQLRSDIMGYILEPNDIPDYLKAAFGSRGLGIATGTETEQQRIDRLTQELTSGKTTFAGLEAALNKYVVDQPAKGTTVRGGQRIPVGMRLVTVGDLYYLVGDVYGAQFAYEVGDLAALIERYGGLESFDSHQTLTQTQFDADYLVVGTDDEIIGATESLQAQFDRDLRAAGFENPPEWLVKDKKAFTVYVGAVNEGWSPERTWDALSNTDAFKGRFTGLDVVLAQLGTTSLTAGINEYTRRESEIRNYLLSARGPNTDVSTGYVSSLVGAGWQPAEAAELLRLEKEVRNNSEAYANINQILEFQGLPTLEPDDFISFLREGEQALTNPEFKPSAVFEAVNDALRFQALLTEGVNIDLSFATDLGTGTSDTIASPEQYSKQAQLAASYLMMSARDNEYASYGLQREDLIAAAFGEKRDGGKSVSEVNNILERVARERSRAAQGFSGAQAFIDANDRLRVQGLGG